MKTTRTIVLVCGLLASATVGFAQDPQDNQVNALRAVPQNEYQDNYDDNRYEQNFDHARANQTVVYETVEETVTVEVYNPYTGRTQLVPKKVLRTVPRVIQRETKPRPDVGGLTLTIDGMGIGIERLSSGRLRVTGVRSGFSADQIGMQTGDVLLEINGRPVQTMNDLNRETRNGYSVKFYRPSNRSTHWGQHSGWQRTNWNDRSPYQDDFGWNGRRRHRG